MDSIEDSFISAYLDKLYKLIIKYRESIGLLSDPRDSIMQLSSSKHNSFRGANFNMIMGVPINNLIISYLEYIYDLDVQIARPVEPYIQVCFPFPFLCECQAFIWTENTWVKCKRL